MNADVPRDHGAHGLWSGYISMALSVLPVYGLSCSQKSAALRIRS